MLSCLRIICSSCFLQTVEFISLESIQFFMQYTHSIYKLVKIKLLIHLLHLEQYWLYNRKDLTTYRLNLYPM